MGLFDKFKKKKEPEITQEPPKTNVVFKKELNNTTRHEAEEKAEKLKKELNSIDLGVKMGGASIGNERIEKENPLADKTEVKFKTIEKGLDIGEIINDAMDDSIIKEYGTDEEKAEMKKRHEIKKVKHEKHEVLEDKFDKASELMLKSNFEDAIPLYKEIINNSEIYDTLVSLSYHDLSYCYECLEDYDNAITVLEEQIKVKKQFGEDYADLESKIETIKNSEKSHLISKFRNNGVQLYYDGKYEEALPLLKKCVELNDSDSKSYNFLADIYIRKKEFESAQKVLEKGVENITHEYLLHNEQNTGLSDKLENINSYLETGQFKRDCLPVDDISVAPRIKEVKAVLKENEDRGIELLEDILDDGTFNNTVYYTLYKTYLKNGKYNSAISISNEAIDNLGTYSQDRKNKWIKYKDKAIAKKEKEDK